MNSQKQPGLHCLMRPANTGGGDAQRRAAAGIQKRRIPVVVRSAYLSALTAASLSLACVQTRLPHQRSRRWPRSWHSCGCMLWVHAAAAAGLEACMCTMEPSTTTVLQEPGLRTIGSLTHHCLLPVVLCTRAPWISQVLLPSATLAKADFRLYPA